MLTRVLSCSVTGGMGQKYAMYGDCDAYTSSKNLLAPWSPITTSAQVWKRSLWRHSMGSHDGLGLPTTWAEGICCWSMAALARSEAALGAVNACFRSAATRAFPKPPALKHALQPVLLAVCEAS